MCSQLVILHQLLSIFTKLGMGGPHRIAEIAGAGEALQDSAAVELIEQVGRETRGFAHRRS